MNRVPPASGRSFTVRAGQTMRIVDPTGGQVADFLCYALGDDGHATAEHLSSGRSIDYAGKLFLTTGDKLYSNRSNVMLTIGRDDVSARHGPGGSHDFTLTPCSPEMYRILYGDDGSHPSCFANLRDSLADFGVTPDQIPTTFNVFMNVIYAASDAPEPGRCTIGPPQSRAGDVLELHAKMDLVVGLTACPSEQTNHVRDASELKPIDWEVV